MPSTTLLELQAALQVALDRITLLEARTTRALWRSDWIVTDLHSHRGGYACLSALPPSGW